METIKSVTNCVTCGSECDVNTDGTTHYYVSKTEHFKTELKEAVELIEKIADGEFSYDDLVKFLTKHKSKE